ncbi:MAG TPA: PLAT/LH2 domain-containing protein [Ktedonobacteraceae bacterium]|nr:PLAT/LH2 domain-containing protein [Ktedonobacteraceae bacterium]
MTNYIILTDTAPDSEANFDPRVQVYLKFTGDQGESNYIRLDDVGEDDLEPGQTDDFHVETRDVGQLEQMHIKIEGTPSKNWHLLQARIQKKVNGTVEREWSAYHKGQEAEGFWFGPNGVREGTLTVPN